MLNNEISVSILESVKTVLNSPIIPGVIAGFGAIYFGIKFYKTNKEVNEYRKQVQQEIINKTTNLLTKRMYFVASAGSHDKSACEQIEAVDINSCDFLDRDGNALDLSLYDFFIVHGDSMQYANISTGDLLFVKKGFMPNDLKDETLPQILVLRYKEHSDGKPRFKVRRAWHVGIIKDNLKEVAIKITKEGSFSILTQQEGYMGNDWMLKDLEERIITFGKDYPEYDGKVVLSTTFDTKEKKIHFSIHPINSVVGIVSESYTISQKK